jgi:hypothetical protein
MSQYHGVQNEFQEAFQNDTSTPLRARTSRHNDRSESNLQPIEDINESASEQKQYKQFPKIRLRLEAFLGEWFSPDYYESITPPPNSVLMLAAAKAELLRRVEQIDSPEDPSKTASRKGYFPGGWGSPSTTPTTPEMNGMEAPSTAFSTLSLQSPGRDRASTVSSTLNSRVTQPLGTKANFGGYIPPTPRYAISPTDHIPSGYVAHAREACVEVDYSWDSTKPPQDWGDGGEYGEEWSSMHKRFRTGLNKMINWYRIHHDSNLQTSGHKRTLHPIREENYDEEVEVDTVLVLVTHGAGCNALIGALTDQPVLIDVGMASLTMAVYKGIPELDPSHKLHYHSHSAHILDQPLSKEYSVIITASVEHLRAGTTPLAIPILQDPSSQLPFTTITQPKVTQNISHPKYRLSNTSIITSSPIDSPIDIPTPSSLRYGGVRRSASAATRSSSGLWSLPESDVTSRKNTMNQLASTEEQHEGIIQASQNGRENKLLGDEPISVHKSSDEIPPSASDKPAPALWPKHEEKSVSAASGMWSAPASTSTVGLWNPMAPEVSERGGGTKRRWTVNENPWS